MSIESQLEKEEELLEEELNNGDISMEDFNKVLNELHIDARAEALERAEAAYREELYGY